MRGILQLWIKAHLMNLKYLSAKRKTCFAFSVLRVGFAIARHAKECYAFKLNFYGFAKAMPRRAGQA